MVSTALLLFSLAGSPAVLGTAVPAPVVHLAAAQGEDEEPFAWDMLSGALMMSGGFAAGLGSTVAGAGVLLATAPGADAGMATGGYVVAGAGAAVALGGLAVASTGGGILLFTADEE